LANASADQQNRNRSQNNSNNGNNRGNSEKYSQNRNSNLQWKLDLVRKLAHHHKHQEPVQLDPGRPDGRVPTPDVATPVPPAPANGRPGYVWVNGHWEREKANGTSINTPGGALNATVEIRDHRTPGTTPAGRPGHGTYGQGHGYGVKSPPVGNNGSVQVSDSPRRPQDNTIYGTGIGIGDLINIHNPKTIIDHLSPGGFEAASNPRDHRKPQDPRRNQR
jgi:hypothetical protein